MATLVVDDGLCGVTSNPAIFEKGISGSSDYTEALTTLAREPELDAKARYERLAIQDIQAAADVLHPVYARTKRRDARRLPGPRGARSTGLAGASRRRCQRGTGLPPGRHGAGVGMSFAGSIQ
jgi:hypothetical protein